MQGQYKTQEGKLITVSHFDADNKIAYAYLGDGESRWCPESEYSTWAKEGVEEVVVEEAVKKKVVKEKSVADEKKKVTKKKK